MSKHYKTLSIVSFSLYILVAIWIFYFKASLGRDLHFLHWDIGFNFIPFSELFPNGGFDASEFVLLFLNIIGFIPVGLLGANLFKKHPFICGCVISILFTLCIELVQYFTKFGSSQLGDLISNSLGGILGAFLYIKIKDKINDDIKSKILFVSSIVMVCLIVLGFVTTTIRWTEYITNPYL